jgi:galactoside O-acetyltransferase
MTSLDHVSAPLVIKDNVWIGSHVCIPGGITINSGTVVAAGTVVTKDVEADTIVSGVPAQIIGKRN